jgi:carotenoid cleavage dioxygenase-like enzyme
VNQVVEQAENKYGLSVLGFTGSKNDYDPVSVAKYKQGQSIAITTYSSVFNVNPFFLDRMLLLLMMPMRQRTIYLNYGLSKFLGLMMSINLYGVYYLS